MKTIVLPLIFLLVCSFTVSAQSSNSVFNLVIDGKSVCTAWAAEGADGQRVMVSAGHCVGTISEKSQIYAFDVESGTRFPLALLEFNYQWSATSDYALFRYTTASVPERSLKTTRLTPAVGDRVTTIIGPLGLVPFNVSGFYAGRMRLADEPHADFNGMYGIQLPAAPGASGSPVFDSTGKVWGILVGGFSRFPGIALVVPIPANKYGLGL